MGTYAKTEAGRAEVGQRQHKLAPAMRSLLLLVDGQRDLTTLRHFATSLRAPDDAIEQLDALGLIAPKDRLAPASPGAAAAEATAPTDTATRFITLSGLISEGVRAHLGLRGFLMQLRVERCSNADELLQVLPEVSSAIAKARTKPFADEWERVVRAAMA